jgi:oxygen-independent coproporphyrinogen-3 oxidase
MVSNQIRKVFIRQFIHEKSIALTNNIPSFNALNDKFMEVNSLGLYLHIPFCEQICPYCPYNKEIYHPETAKNYTRAVIRETDLYSSILGRKPVTSFYIGGGTPTTMLRSGIKEILEHIYKVFNMQCHIHMESHPNDLSEDNLNLLKSMGVKYLSMGMEALQDRHLKTLNRPYSAEAVTKAIGRAVRKDFECVNVDLMFALPGQTCREVKEAGETLVGMGIDQVAAYPLFRFPYTKLGREAIQKDHKVIMLFRRRKMMRILESIFYKAGFDRTSVWAFTKKGVEKYCSVTVPLYLGLGASGGTYLHDIFYLNTFNAAEYIHALEENKLPIALSFDLSENMQMASWLYWKIYETKFRKSDFYTRFGKDFDRVYGRFMKMLSIPGFLKEYRHQIILSDKGSYWIHAFEDLFSIDYISKLWGKSMNEPWPEKIILLD